MWSGCHHEDISGGWRCMFYFVTLLAPWCNTVNCCPNCVHELSSATDIVGISMQLMNLLFSFLKPDHPHGTLSAGYFAKVVICLMMRKTLPLVSYVQVCVVLLSVFTPLLLLFCVLFDSLVLHVCYSSCSCIGMSNNPYYAVWVKFFCGFQLTSAIVQLISRSLAQYW